MKRTPSRVTAALLAACLSVAAAGMSIVGTWQVMGPQPGTITYGPDGSYVQTTVVPGPYGPRTVMADTGTYMVSGNVIQSRSASGTMEQAVILRNDGATMIIETMGGRLVLRRMPGM
jgi:hypothetical protein